jgi:hypothetical protein
LGPVKKDALLQEVLDHETWTINLDEANESSEDPKWYRLYSAKNAFAMESLRPAAWAKVIDRLVQNPDFFDLFYKSVVLAIFRQLRVLHAQFQVLLPRQSSATDLRHQMQAPDLVRPQERPLARQAPVVPRPRVDIRGLIKILTLVTCFIS